MIKWVNELIAKLPDTDPWNENSEREEREKTLQIIVPLAPHENYNMHAHNTLPQHTE